MTASDVASIAIVLMCVGAFSLLLLIVCARVISLRETPPDGRLEAAPQMQSATGPSPFIEMPAHLKTRQEMVDWMLHDLPRQTAGLILSDPE
jgi:hypothetical protein